MACNGVPVPGRAKLLNAAAGRRTAVAAEQEFSAPGGAPGIRGTPAGRGLPRAAGKNLAAGRGNIVEKTVNWFNKEASFSSSVAQEMAPAPGREM